MKTALIAMLLALTLLVAACTTQTAGGDAMMEKKEAGDTMMEKTGDAMEKEPGDAMMEKEGADAMEKEEGDAMIEKENAGSMEKEDDDAMIKAEGDAMMEKDGDAMMESKYMGTVISGTTSQYLEFNKDDYEKAKADGKTVVLNFYANWCPDCKAEEPRAEAAFSQLDDPNVVGFRVNYKDSDTDEDEEALAAEFGITYQHTKVIIQDNEKVLKNLETWDTARYLSEIAKYS